jgi:hypothetical protein
VLLETLLAMRLSWPSRADETHTAVVCDPQVSDELSLRNPALYVRGQWNLDLNVKRFVQWIFNAALHAIIGFFLCYGVIQAVRMLPPSVRVCVWHIVLALLNRICRSCFRRPVM